MLTNLALILIFAFLLNTYTQTTLSFLERCPEGFYEQNLENCSKYREFFANGETCCVKK
jgi:hypothetical protein